MSSFHDNLNQWSRDNGFHSWGASTLSEPQSLQHYRHWIEQNYHGEMDYLARHLPLKENPRLLNPKLQSALIFAHSYFPHPEPFSENSEVAKSLRIALYAQGQDYHSWLRAKLEKIAENLRQAHPEEIFLTSTDSAPVLERDLGHRAGLGWFGKNTCLIQRGQGSFFLIGEILTSMAFHSEAQISPDFCGTCNRCIEVCPTQALEKPRVLNATKCISYWTIESRQVPPLEIRSQMGDHFFGCDLCQTVCPWNQKVFGRELQISPRKVLNTQEREQLEQDLRQILTLSGKQLQKKFAGTPLLRAGPFGLRRNAMIVAANQRLRGLKSEISKYLQDEKLAELSQWALDQLEIQVSP